ncbi:MAG: histidine kinase [Alteromonadaceae bacterium]|nr:MAG: histidine kinase [Alteromonadaceae bacterium]
MKSEVLFDQAKDLIKGFIVPPKPSVVSAIQKVAPDLKKMSDLLKLDPALSAAILKVINSPTIGLAANITSIEYAMELLGYNSVINIINAVLLKKTLKSTQKSSLLDRYWRSTNEVSAAMAAMVRQLNLHKASITVDEAYCLGLFHNCGMPVMFNRYDCYFDYLREAYDQDDRSVNVIENEKYQTNHSVLGYFITKSWHLPDVICRVVQLHHDPKTLGQLDWLPEKTATLLAILKMAEHITNESSLMDVPGENNEWKLFSQNILDYIGISEVDFEELGDVILDSVERGAS